MFPFPSPLSHAVAVFFKISLCVLLISLHFSAQALPLYSENYVVFGCWP
jgi:hypothetical protein